MLRKHLRALAAFALLLSACASALADYMVDILEPASPMALDAYRLHWGIMWVCVAIFFIVFGAMFWSVYQHRRSRGAKAAQFHENTTIEVVWTVVPLVVLVAMAWPATQTMLDMKDASGADMAIKVTGYQWRWEYEYQQEGLRFISNMSTPRDQIEEYQKVGAKKNENYLLEVDRPMVVPVNKKVRLLITSNDVMHGWYVPQLGVNQNAITGFIKDAWFTATKVGTFRGQCAQICGKEHSFMPIVVEVKSEADYAKWVQEQKALMPPPTPTAVPQQAPAQSAGAAPAQMAAAGAAAAGGVAASVAAAKDSGAKMTPADLKAKGEQVYAANCVACHQATGKGMPPTFPPLEGSKVANGPKAGHIAVVLKGRPGTAMASFARLSDAELAAVVTYTRTAFGNKGDAVQPAEIAAARAAK